MRKKVVCLGEVLWDNMPGGMFLGGAPLNVAINLKQLGADVEIISAVGDDEPGEKAIKAIQNRGLSTSYIQRNEYPTGMVQVKVSEEGEPDYEISQPAAWDFIEWNDELHQLMKKAEVAVFGSLAQRNLESRHTIQKLLGKTRGVNVFDINLRHPFEEREAIKQSLEKTDILKLNEEELDWLASDKPQKESLKVVLTEYNLKTIILTQGKNGASIFGEGNLIHEPAEKVNIQDSVGAGDAFLAGVIFGMLKNQSQSEILKLANKLGGFVAGKDGATPELYNIL